MSKCRLFKAVQDTLPTQLNSKKEAGDAVKKLLEQDEQSRHEDKSQRKPT